MSKLRQKADCFAYFVRFSDYALLHPIRYTPRFCQIKTLLRYLSVVYQHSICGFQVKVFHIDLAFTIDLAFILIFILIGLHEMVLF